GVATPFARIELFAVTGTRSQGSRAWGEYGLPLTVVAVAGPVAGVGAEPIEAALASSGIPGYTVVRVIRRGACAAHSLPCPRVAAVGRGVDVDVGARDARPALVGVTPLNGVGVRAGSVMRVLVEVGRRLVNNRARVVDGGTHLGRVGHVAVVVRDR